MAVYRVRITFISSGSSKFLGRDHLHSLTITKYLSPSQIIDLPDNCYYRILYSDFD